MTKTKPRTNKVGQLEEHLGTHSNSYALNYNFVICTAGREEEGDLQSKHCCTAKKKKTAEKESIPPLLTVYTEEEEEKFRGRRSSD